VVTAGDATHLARRVLKMSVAGAAAAFVLGFAGLALGASSYSDPAGDDNAAPDLTSVAVAKAADGTLTITIGVANFQTLPLDSWFNIWLDLDSNQATGSEGDEALVRFNANGGIDFELWNGSQLTARPPTGMAGRFDAGVLTLTAPESAFGGVTSLGVLVVSARAQALGDDELISSDFAPNDGRSAFTGTAQVTFPDPGGDHDAAPDITAIRVSDAKDGWVNFAISTLNYATLPGNSVVLLGIDRDNRPSTGDEGMEVVITSIEGEAVLERWDAAARRWRDDTAPSRVRVRNGGNVVTIGVHRSELENTPRFGFAVTAVDFDLDAEVARGVDFAPDEVAFYRYTLANKPALTLTATRLFASPARPRAGKPFSVTLVVRRSDTNRGIPSGSVTCRVLVGGNRVQARGSVVGGAARCAIAVPASAKGARLRGSIGVRVQGKSVSANFSYVVG
jgi:hypothetical protein